MGAVDVAIPFGQSGVDEVGDFARVAERGRTAGFCAEGAICLAGGDSAGVLPGVWRFCGNATRLAGPKFENLAGKK
jgi:hypothetical protein